MNLTQLIAEQSSTLWPDGEIENLIAAHGNFYQEGLWSLNKWVPCFQFNHTNVFDHCATYFNCGMTVLPKPPGSILKLYVIDRVNPDTGKEDPAAVPNWCSKVTYHQVDYCHLESYVRLCQRSQGSTVAATADAIVSSLFGVFRRKRSYPQPTDEGMEALPPLPGGFHYPQASTDAGGRSPSGVWAIYRGRIYIAPWIQSTETVVIEWNGVKSKWSPVDLIEDDIKFKEAVRLFVAWKHESTYGEPDRAEQFKNQFFGNPGAGIPGALPELVHECRERMRVRTCASGPGWDGAAAQGIGVSSDDTGGGSYVNDQAAQYTAECPTGKTGASKTVTITAGSVASAFSVADANAKAQQKAQADAQAQLVCSDTQAVFHNVEKKGRADCPGASGTTPAATGPSVSVTVPANTARFDAATQQEADDAAQDYANELAQQLLACTYHNAPVTKSASCPENTTGDDETGEVLAGEFQATTAEGGQARADALAAAEATKRAVAKLVCTGVTFAVGNTIQYAPYSAFCPGRATSGGQTVPGRNISVTGVCQPNFHIALATEDTRVATQTAMNENAKITAYQNALALWQAACIHQ